MALSPVRVLIDVSPFLLAEAISRLLRRNDVVICLDAAAGGGDSGPVEIAITDGTRLASSGAGLVLRVPAQPHAVPERAAADDPYGATTIVVDLSDLGELVRLVGNFADDFRRYPRWRPGSTR